MANKITTEERTGDRSQNMRPIDIKTPDIIDSGASTLDFFRVSHLNFDIVPLFLRTLCWIPFSQLAALITTYRISCQTRYSKASSK